MKKTKIILCSFILLLSVNLFAQNDSVPYFKGATGENRLIQHRNIIKNIITKNLSLPLTDSTEENWQDAFWAMEVIRYKSPWANNRIQLAFDSIEKRNTAFQRALLELAYSNYPKEFDSFVNQLANHTVNEKILAMCIEYLLQS